MSEIKNPSVTLITHNQIPCTLIPNKDKVQMAKKLLGRTVTGRNKLLS